MFSMCLTSCSEDYISPLQGIMVSGQTFETGTNSKTVSLGTKDLSKCTIVSSANWCSASIQVSSVVITLLPNDTFEERHATVTLTDPEDATTLSFNVVQKQKDAILIDNKSYTIPEDGGEVKIDVQSNIAYNVEIPSDANWLKRVSTRSLTNSSVVLKASKNESGDERSAMVTFINSDTGVKSQVIIYQGFTPYLEIDEDTISISPSGGNFKIRVETNTEIDIVCNNSWVVINGRSELKGIGFIQDFHIDPVSNGSSRSATITFRCKNSKWGISKKVVVKQTVRFFIRDKEISLGVGEWTKINLVNETGKDVSWLSWNSTVADVDYKGRVYGKKVGIAKISVWTKDLSYRDEIKVKVGSEPFVTCTCGVVYGVVSKNGYYYQGNYLNAKIENNNENMIQLKKCTVYKNGSYYRSESYNDYLPSGFSEWFSITDNVDQQASYYCEWTFVLEGNTYTISSKK